MTTDEARDWLLGPDAAAQPPTRPDVIRAICEADDTRPIAGVDRTTWGRMTPNDRMQIARFAAVLRVPGPHSTGGTS